MVKPELCIFLDRIEIEIFVTDKLVYPWPDGGLIYEDKFYSRKTQTRLNANLVLVEKIAFNNIPFTKEYWLFYHGMGQWIATVLSYTKHKEKYYIFKFTESFVTIPPGSEIGKKQITKKELVDYLLKKLKDEKNSDIKTFNKILSSFIFTK
jgi:hypothetical protein